jgi:AcrR family transcriptional regulator
MSARDTWLAEGIAVLRTEGADGLRIDRLAGRLGVTKGSFHHHFRGASGYRNALLDKIENDEASALTRLAVDYGGLSAEQALAAIPDRLDRLYDADLDRALRVWAARDEDVRAVLARIDHRRLALLEELWRKILGPGTDRARIAALVPYLVVLGATASVPPISRKELDQVLHLLSDLVTHVEP